VAVTSPGRLASKQRVDCQVALQRPYTFVVLALLILLASPVLILRHRPTSSSIDIPVIGSPGSSPALNRKRWKAGSPRSTRTGLASRISRARTTKVYGRCSATLTIHTLF